MPSKKKQPKPKTPLCRIKHRTRPKLEAFKKEREWDYSETIDRAVDLLVAAEGVQVRFAS